MVRGYTHYLPDAQYDATIAFYRDGLELPVIGGWDEGPHAGGTMFRAACGIEE